MKKPLFQKDIENPTVDLGLLCRYPIFQLGAF